MRVKKDFKVIKRFGRTYYFNPELKDSLVTSLFASVEKVAEPMGTPNSRRIVSLIPSVPAVHKINYTVGVKERFYTTVGLQSIRGKYGLFEEASNLYFLQDSHLAPQLYAYVESGFLSRRQEVFLEYFADSETLGFCLKNSTEFDQEDVFNSVFQLFVSARNEGFAHLDPHPDNILITPDGLRFIDFEGCYIGEVCSDFYYGFSLGYIYCYWLNRHCSESDFDAFVFENVNKHEVSDAFYRYYGFFKAQKVSRRKRYHYFFTPKNRFKETLINSRDRSPPLVK